MLARERMRLKGDFSRSTVSLSLPLAPSPYPPLQLSPPASVSAQGLSLFLTIVCSRAWTALSHTHIRGARPLGCAFVKINNVSHRLHGSGRRASPALHFKRHWPNLLWHRTKIQPSCARPSRHPTREPPSTLSPSCRRSHARNDISPRLRPAMGSKLRESGPKSLLR